MKISVCVPMYNELSAVAETARQLNSALEGVRYSYGYDYEMIFVDDGSTDGCAETLKNVAFIEGMTRTRVVRFKENRGKGRAMREAVKRSTGDFVICTDCDLAYGADTLRSAIDSLSRDTEVILGSRNLLSDGYYGYSVIRKIASKAFVGILRMFYAFKYSDSQCGFKVYRGDIARRVFSLCRTDGFAYDYEAVMLAHKLGYKIEEMPVKVFNNPSTRISIMTEAFRILKDVGEIRKRLKKFDKKKKKKR